MKTVLVVFGGRTAEHDVSIITAHIPIIESLEASGRYRVVPLYITANGLWLSDPSLNKLATFQRADLDAHLAKLKPVHLSFNDGLSVVAPGLRTREEKIDIVFPSMHGTYGEDGSLMGLLRMANVPFVGCGLEASVIAMDKVLTKTVLEKAGIPGVTYFAFTKTEWAEDAGRIRAEINTLAYPLFVKPAHLGSSIGITKVDAPEGLENALEVALHYDERVIVEEGVSDLIEVTLPIMGNEELRPALVERTKTGFFDFEQKYLHSGGKKGGGAHQAYSELPAQIGDELTARVIELGRAAYRAIGAAGIARVDFLIDAKSNQVYVNEINPLPGSLYHHNWRRAGVPSVDLVTELIRFAFERHEREQGTNFVFRSNVLQHLGAGKTQD